MTSRTRTQFGEPDTTHEEPRDIDDGPSFPIAENRGDTGILELLLRDDDTLDARILEQTDSLDLLRNMLLVAVGGFVLYGLTVGAIVQFHIGLPPDGIEFQWFAPGLHLVSLPVSLVSAFLTAAAVGLPSFYFYSRLAGLDISVRTVALQLVRGLAKTALALTALAPFYLAFALSAESAARPAYGLARWALLIPFPVGLVGIASVYSSFRRMIGDEVDVDDGLQLANPERRTGLLGMVLAWGLLFTLVGYVSLVVYHEMTTSFFRYSDLFF